MALSKRLISALIAFSMSATIATTAFAQTDNSITLNEEQNQLQTVEPSQEEKISIEYANIPEQLDVVELKAQGFSARVKSEETDLSDIVLEKNDGTRALYIFDSPVKYISDDGDVVDKSNKVIKKGNVFKSESNDIEVTLPFSLSSGIAVDDEELNLSMRPISNNNLVRVLSVGKKSGEESVKYEDVFDEYTDIEYTYTYDGVKEDIILEKYNGTNKFDFELLTNGLELCEDKGVLLLKDNNGNVRAVIGEIVVFSADNKNNTMGKYQIIEKEKNNCYVISVTVDNEYLKSEKTKYPVTIDPSIKSNVDNNGIEDMQVFKGTDGKGDTEKSAGLSGVSRVGWSDWGACRTLLKFKQKNVLTNHNIKAKGQIISASIEMRDLMCQGDEVPVYCTQFAGKSWNESGQYTWNALNAENTGKGGSMLPVSYANGKKKSDTNPSTDTMSHWFKWNVSNIVKNWVGNTSDIEKGIEFYALPMLEGSSVYASYMKTFGSVQADSKYRPYFHIEYEKGLSINIISGNNKFYINHPKTLYCSVNPANIKYKIKWTSSNHKVAVVSDTAVVTLKDFGTSDITATVTSENGQVVKSSIKIKVEVDPSEKIVYDFYSTAKEYEIVFMNKFAERFTNAKISEVIKSTKIFRKNKGTTKIENVINDFKKELNWEINEYVAKILLSEYELYSKNSSFADLMEAESKKWSNGMHVFLGMLYYGINEKINPYNEYLGCEFDKRWFTADGTYKYPPNNGFKGKISVTTLNKNVTIDRYGESTGRFLSPVGTPYEQRSLGPYTSMSQYHKYKVIKPIPNVQSGKVAAWGSWKGGGTQYLLEYNVNYYLNNGYLEEIV